jgi:hypothetical protein
MIWNRLSTKDIAAKLFQKRFVYWSRSVLSFRVIRDSQWKTVHAIIAAISCFVLICSSRSGVCPVRSFFCTHRRLSTVASDELEDGRRDGRKGAECGCGSSCWSTSHGLLLACNWCHLGTNVSHWDWLYCASTYTFIILACSTYYLEKWILLALIVHN